MLTLNILAVAPEVTPVTVVAVPEPDVPIHICISDSVAPPTKVVLSHISTFLPRDLN